MWNEALTQAGVDASSTLRRVENVYYPPAFHVANPSSSRAEVAPKAPVPSQVALAIALPTFTVPSKEADQAKAGDKDKEIAKDTVPDKEPIKEPVKESSNEKGAS